MIGYAETVHGPIGLRQPGAMSGATVPASSPPVTGRHRAHARGTPASWCPPPNDRGRALTRISANLVARGCKGIYVPAWVAVCPGALLSPRSDAFEGHELRPVRSLGVIGGNPYREWKLAENHAPLVASRIPVHGCKLVQTEFNPVPNITP